MEDEPLVRGMVAEILRPLGYQVLEAANGDEALRVSERHRGPVHLLLTDVVMPGMSGRELAEQLLSRRPETKVLFMSGYTNDDVMRRGVLDGRTAFIQKPFTATQFATKVRDVLDQPRRPGIS